MSSTRRRVKLANSSPIQERLEERDSPAAACTQLRSVSVTRSFQSSTTKSERNLSIKDEDESDPSVSMKRVRKVKVKIEEGEAVPVKEEPEGKQSAVVKRVRKRVELKFEREEESAPAAKRRKVGERKPLAAPPHWEEVWDGIQQMRSQQLAPVDSMGCERLSDGLASAVDQRFQTLVSLMLSSQTKDQMTAAATGRLLQHGLSVASIISTSEETIRDLIYGVGFHNRKAIYLKKTAEILMEKHGGDIPRDYVEITKLPGVGPKMAHLCMQAAWGDTVGIGVDVHVHRICNRLKWTGPGGTNTPEKTRKALEEWLPRDRWQPINVMMVGFGQVYCSKTTCEIVRVEDSVYDMAWQRVMKKGKFLLLVERTICKPIGPKCGQCLVNKLCPVGRKTVRPKAEQKNCDSEAKEEDN